VCSSDLTVQELFEPPKMIADNMCYPKQLTLALAYPDRNDYKFSFIRNQLRPDKSDTRTLAISVVFLCENQVFPSHKSVNSRIFFIAPK
jgi:hypothetical protein